MMKLPEMALNIVAPFNTQCSKKLKHLPSCPVALHKNRFYSSIRLSVRRLLKLLVRCTILALFIVSLPWNLNPFLSTPLIEPSIDELSNKAEAKDLTSTYGNHLQILPLLFRDLANEGLLGNKGDGIKLKTVFVINGVEEEEAINRSGIFGAHNMEFIPLTDLDRHSFIDDNAFDFAFAFSFSEASKFIDRTLKPGGIVAMLLSDDPSAEFYTPSNYRIAYMRQFELMAVAMKKTGSGVETKSSTVQRKLLRSPSPEAKKAALEKLEDVRKDKR